METQGVEINTLEAAVRFGIAKGSSPLEALEIAWDVYGGRTLSPELQERILLRDLPCGISRYWARNNSGEHKEAKEIFAHLREKIESQLKIKQAEKSAVE